MLKKQFLILVGKEFLFILNIESSLKKTKNNHFNASNLKNSTESAAILSTPPPPHDCSFSNPQKTKAKLEFKM
jgi:hypothetical protein